MLRENKRWPCFEDTTDRLWNVKFRSKGFHEKQSSGTEGSSSSEEEDETVTSPPHDDQPPSMATISRPGPLSSKRARLDLSSTAPSAMFNRSSVPSVQPGPMPPILQHSSVSSSFPYRPFMHTSNPYPQSQQSSIFVQPQRHQQQNVVHPSPMNSNTSAPHFPPISAAAPQSSSGSHVSSSPASHVPVASLKDPNAEMDEEAIADAPLRHFWRLAKNVLSTVYHTGAEGWDMILALRRMILVSRGYFSDPDIEVLRDMFEEECRRHPGELLAILNPVAKEPQNRILFISPEAEAVVGKVAEADGGLKQPLFPKSEYWVILKQTVLTWTLPGRRSVYETKVVDKHGDIRPILIELRCVENPTCMIFRGRMLD